jgi:hypothetical protein
MRWLVALVAVVLVACRDTDPLPVPPGSGQLPPGGSTQGAPAPGSGGTAPDGGPTVVDMPAAIMDMFPASTDLGTPGAPDAGGIEQFCSFISCLTNAECQGSAFGCSRCDTATGTCR